MRKECISEGNLIIECTALRQKKALFDNNGVNCICDGVEILMYTID